jgi:flagellar biosynthetic protein FlhB
LEQAREQGQVPQSRELSAVLVMLAGAASVWVAGRYLAERIAALVRQGLSLDRRAAFDPSAMGVSLVGMAGDALLALVPVFVVLILATLAGPAAIGGLVFAPKAMQIDLSRLDPIKGLGRMFSPNGLVELVKALAKALLVGGVAFWVVWQQREALLGLLGQPLEASLASAADRVLFSTILIVASMALIAAVDVPYQLWLYHRRLRMTKEELRREAKELDGDPQLKARIRQQQRELARRRMMQEVPKADVVVTNPTHFSVALKYESARMRAPAVVAKGRNQVALRIREIAGEHGVPLLESPALARTLYRHAEIGDEIPAVLYAAVAEVMAYVYQLGAFNAGHGLPPQPPETIEVPDGMDPGPGE